MKSISSFMSLRLMEYRVRHKSLSEFTSREARRHGLSFDMRFYHSAPRSAGSPPYDVHRCTSAAVPGMEMSGRRGGSAVFQEGNLRRKFVLQLMSSRMDSISYVLIKIMLEKKRVEVYPHMLSIT